MQPKMTFIYYLSNVACIKFIESEVMFQLKKSYIFFLTSHYAAPNDLEHRILLPPLPGCQDYRIPHYDTSMRSFSFVPFQTNNFFFAVYRRKTKNTASNVPSHLMSCKEYFFIKIQRIDFSKLCPHSARHGGILL